jgi:hypothetical protein
LNQAILYPFHARNALDEAKRFVALELVGDGSRQLGCPVVHGDVYSVVPKLPARMKAFGDGVGN